MYYLHNINNGKTEPIQFNWIVCNIKYYIKLNFLVWGIYSAVKMDVSEYAILDRFNGNIEFIINKNKRFSA